MQTATVNGKSLSYSYNADGIRTKKVVDGTATYYVLDGSKVVSQKTGTNDPVYFEYDATGKPVSMSYLGMVFYYVTNMQGDVIALVNSAGDKVVEYTYDPWGKLLSTTGLYANDFGYLNPFRYRGYYYDNETGLYYLNSRYYDPEVGRFINADSVVSGTGESVQGYNLFAYCNNNPIMGYDPSGYWDWGGVITGLGILAGAAISIATFGIGTPLGALVASAAITTGIVVTCAAATDSVMVIDTSFSMQISSATYVKGGGSIVIDFEEDSANFYSHAGGGLGCSTGISYSVGLVDNYNEPLDYAKHFIDVNLGYEMGLDHGWNPF